MFEYLVALPIRKMPVNEAYIKGEQLPLHCTLMHWFQTATPARALFPVLAELAQSIGEKGIELVSEHPESFGPHNDVPVYVLARNEPLQLLHTRLLLAIHSTPPNELRWIGAGYRPHVADCRDTVFTPGRCHYADHLVLVERVDDKRIVRDLHFFEPPF